MPPHDLGEDAALHVRQIEDARLRAVLRVQHDLEQEIPELLGKCRRGASFERVVDLVGLLQQERPQRQMVLLAVPGAAAGSAQPSHQPGQPVGAGRVPGVGQCRKQVGAVLQLGRRHRRNGRPRRLGGAGESQHRMVGRVEPAQQVQRGGAVAMPPRQHVGLESVRFRARDRRDRSRTVGRQHHQGDARVERPPDQGVDVRPASCRHPGGCRAVREARPGGRPWRPDYAPSRWPRASRSARTSCALASVVVPTVCSTSSGWSGGS